MILRVAGRDRLRLGILGVDSGGASHRSRDLPSALPPPPRLPLTFPLCPRWVQHGLTSGREGRGGELWPEPRRAQRARIFLTQIERHGNYNAGQSLKPNEDGWGRERRRRGRIVG